jgi:acetoacetyl-CoA synthetase
VFEPVAFDHPLVILFSSGTTGLPKAIVHGHGGVLLEHLKNHALSWDLGPGDRFMWFTTTAWMMWNALVSGLLVGASLVLLDGNPLHPELGRQWELASVAGATIMGLSPGFIMACRRQGEEPARRFDLSRLRSLAAAGSPLPAEGSLWIREQFGPDVPLNVGSGGTDVCTGLVQGGPLLPVWAGEMSGRCLGVSAWAYDEDGGVVVGELGELVITEPMPSMPVGLWGDDDGRRLAATYFEHYPGVMRFGDWIRFSEWGSCVITGRSDATLNRGGVRIGTAELYRVVEDLPGITDSLAVHLEDAEGGPGELILLVVMEDGTLDDERRRSIASAVKHALSPRHVPDTIAAIADVPRNLTGKKLELPVKKILQGADPASVVSRDAMANPASLAAIIELASARSRSPIGGETARG